MTFAVRVEGLPDAQVIAPEITLEPSESHTGPLIIRIPAGDSVARTMPFRVLVSSPSGEMAVEATFKTGVTVGDQ